MTRRYLPEAVVVILVTVASTAFFCLSAAVSSGRTLDFDRRFLLLFRNPEDITDPLGPAWVEVVLRDLTALGGVVPLIMLTLAVCGYLWLQHKPRMAGFVLVSLAGGSLCNSLLKLLFDRPRPDLVPHGTAAAMSSFPSAHAMMSAVVFLTLGTLLAYASQELRIKWYILGWSVLLTVLVGVSRVYLGVHWPTDVIAGWLAGGVWVLLSLWVLAKICRSAVRPAQDCGKGA